MYSVGVSSSSDMFRVEKCVLRVEDGKMTAILTLGGTGYSYLYPGTAEEAALAATDAWIPYAPDWNGKYTYSVPISGLDADIVVAAYSRKYEKWYDRTLRFFASTLKPYDEIAPAGVYRGVLLSDTWLNGCECLLSSNGEAMTATLEVGAEVRALNVAGLTFPTADGKCDFSLPSLDKRVPFSIVTGEETTTGWIALESGSLLAHALIVDDGVYTIDALTDSSLLRFTRCVLTVQHGQMRAILTAKNNNYDYLYIGSASSAKTDEALWIPAIPDENGAYTYALSIDSLDNEIRIATHSPKKGMWYDRTLTLTSASIKKQGE